MSGLLDEEWRIRHASVLLLGDLLYKLCGATGKGTTTSGDGNEDVSFGTEAYARAITGALGDARRHQTLAALYLCRCDVTQAVRAAATHVWNVVVPNTPRTIREVQTELWQLVLSSLAAKSDVRQAIGARCIGELVTKLGDRLVADVLPTISQAAMARAEQQRSGVALALTEIMYNTQRETILMYSESFIAAVRTLLCDNAPEVRKLAARAFDALHTAIGSQSLDEIIAPLLKQAVGGDEAALNGLEQVLCVCGAKVFPYVLERLAKQPTPESMKLLSVLAAASGDALTRYLPKILNALLASESLDYVSVFPRYNNRFCYYRSRVLSCSHQCARRTVSKRLLKRSYRT